MGIPAIVSIGGVTTRIQSGSWVEMDGGRGTVKLDVGPLSAGEPDSQPRPADNPDVGSQVTYGSDSNPRAKDGPDVAPESATGPDSGDRPAPPDPRAAP